MSEITKFLKQIPKNSKVCIWGAGAAGKEIKNLIEKKMKDVTVTAFIDTFQAGKIDDIEIYNPNQLSEIKDKFNFLIISTLSEINIIEAILAYYGIEDFIIIKKYFYTLSLLKSHPKEILFVLKHLHSKEDRKLYKMLINARMTDDLSKVEKYSQKKYRLTKYKTRTPKQYLDYINYDAIQTIIEGGMYNGINSLYFKANFKNLKKIYAFELIYENVKNRTIDNILKSTDELEIIKAGLWSEKATLEFKVSGEGSALCNKETKKSNECFDVPTISIDEFVKERNIDKVDFIKMDIEGAEQNALRGAKETLIKHRPQLAISIYHSSQDMYEIPLYLIDLLPDYVFKIGHYSSNLFESVLYAIPKELYKK